MLKTVFGNKKLWSSYIFIRKLIAHSFGCWRDLTLRYDVFFSLILWYVPITDWLQFLGIRCFLEFSPLCIWFEVLWRKLLFNVQRFWMLPSCGEPLEILASRLSRGCLYDWSGYCAYPVAFYTFTCEYRRTNMLTNTWFSCDYCNSTCMRVQFVSFFFKPC